MSFIVREAQWPNGAIEIVKLVDGHEAGRIKVVEVNNSMLTAKGQEVINGRKAWAVVSVGVYMAYRRRGIGIELYLQAAKYANKHRAIIIQHELLIGGHTSWMAKMLWSSSRLKEIPELTIGDQWIQYCNLDLS